MWKPVGSYAIRIDWTTDTRPASIRSTTSAGSVPAMSAARRELRDYAGHLVNRSSVRSVELAICSSIASDTN